MSGIGAQVWPDASVVDQFWIRSAIHSHGSTPDRKSRAVPSSWARSPGEPKEANTTVRCAEARAQRDGGNSGAASGADGVLEDHGALRERPAWERRQGQWCMHCEQSSGPPPQGRWRFRFKDRSLEGR